MKPFATQIAFSSFYVAGVAAPFAFIAAMPRIQDFIDAVYVTAYYLSH